MKITYLNLYDSMDSIWAQDKAIAAKKLEAVAPLVERHKKTFKLTLCWLIAYVVGAVLLITSNPNIFSIIADTLLTMMICTWTLSAYLDMKKAEQQCEYLRHINESYDNDAALSIVTQAIQTASKAHHILPEYTAGVITRIIDKKLCNSNIVVDRGNRKMSLSIADTPITISVSDVKDGELDCITVLKDGFFIGSQSNVCMSNVVQTIPIDLNIEVTETADIDVLKAI